MDRHGGSLAVEGKDARLILRIYLDFLNILIKGPHIENVKHCPGEIKRVIFLVNEVDLKRDVVSRDWDDGEGAVRVVLVVPGEVGGGDGAAKALLQDLI